MKASGSLWQYYRDDPNDNITELESFKYKIKITEEDLAVAGSTKNVKKAVSLKYYCNFWKTLEMPLINCEINHILTCSEDCVISSVTGKIKFEITDTKRYVQLWLYWMKLIQNYY